MDYLIKNATVIDGTGKPRYVSRVGIDKGKIVTKSLPTEAENVIDAAGKMIAAKKII
ncbi:MAG: hypothetical protein IJV00_07755 [Clostridia bacterium]|nr:hypothetical protein [Clostridia bacterium]